MDERTRFINNNVKGRTLDMGCSFGLLHNLIKNDNLFGIDIEINKNYTKNFVNGDVLKLPYKDNTFDTIIAGEIIEHLNDLNGFIDDCHRILKPKGRMIITTPNKKSFVNRIFKSYHTDFHISLMDKDELLRLLKRKFSIIYYKCIIYNTTTIYQNRLNQPSFKERISKFKTGMYGYKMRPGFHQIRNVVQLFLTPYQINVLAGYFRMMLNPFLPESLKEQQIVLVRK